YKPTNPPGRYCPSYPRVISTESRFSTSGGYKEDEGIEPLQSPVPWFSCACCRPFSGIFRGVSDGA
ncbi:hypothetical protein, partial [Microcoleus anatoxicus]